MTKMKHRFGFLAAACTALALMAGMTGCAQPPQPIGLLDVTSRPAEKALMSGMAAYENGLYIDAETLLQLALRTGLASPKDTAAAQKYLAFIYCTSERVLECEAAFRDARRADATFALNRGEQGHPLWGPVYKRVLP